MGVDKRAQEMGNYHCKETTLTEMMGETVYDRGCNREERTWHMETM
jgi:hypothetical protein